VQRSHAAAESFATACSQCNAGYTCVLPWGASDGQADLRECAVTHRFERPSVTRIGPMWTWCFGIVAVCAAAASPAYGGCRDEPTPGVDWSECEKARLMIPEHDLSKGRFIQTFFTSTDLRGSNLSGADLTQVELSMASLAGANLAGANLQKAIGQRTDFTAADLRNVQFAGSEFSRSKFVDANLSGSVFFNSELNRSDFKGANLSGADMSKAELARVKLADAKISGVNFTYSNLSRADLSGADLGEANFTGSYLFLTRFAGSDLSRATGLIQAQIDIACGSAETKLPAGLTAPSTWPCPDYDDD